mmetsp:Transcript_18134/g.42815  ORF Transcript_18134/g.42815 Transcript_18134/m.42815 type:complete len:631 (-) Transcript_18134:61-1953(-)
MEGGSSNKDESKPDRDNKKPTVVEEDQKMAAVPNMKEALEQLEDAVQKLPAEEKEAYLNAKKKAPELVERESNPRWFLQFAQYDTQQAARRLASYWKLRCAFFEERAFLPMNQTGEGAITKNDILVMSTAYWTYLPRDDEGRTVLFNDYSWLATDSPSSRIRNLFYMQHVLMQNETTVEKGCVVILFLSQATLDVLSANTINGVSVANVWNDAFPFRISSLILIPKNKKQAFIKEALPIVNEYFDKTWLVAKENRCFVQYHNQDQLLRTLRRSHGLQQESLPEILGGSFSLENFIMWQERQIRVEWELPLGQLDAFEYGEYSAKPLNQLSSQEKIERKRRYNILHSRRKRRRDRVEADVVNKQVEKLKFEQEDLRTETERLLLLLSRATGILTELGLPIPASLGPSPISKKQRMDPSSLAGIEARLDAHRRLLGSNNNSLEALAAHRAAVPQYGGVGGLLPDLSLASQAFPSLALQHSLGGLGLASQAVQESLLSRVGAAAAPFSSQHHHHPANASSLLHAPMMDTTANNNNNNNPFLAATAAVSAVPRMPSQLYLPITRQGQPTVYLPVDAATLQSLASSSSSTAAAAPSSSRRDMLPSSLNALIRGGAMGPQDFGENQGNDQLRGGKF